MCPADPASSPGPKVPTCCYNGGVRNRPFGTSTLLAAYDDTGPQLYLVEPSGNCQVGSPHELRALHGSVCPCWAALLGWLKLRTVLPACAAVLWHRGGQGAAGGQDGDRAAQAGRDWLRAGRHRGRQDVRTRLLSCMLHAA